MVPEHFGKGLCNLVSNIALDWDRYNKGEGLGAATILPAIVGKFTNKKEERIGSGLEQYPLLYNKK